ncbi:MAG TPA: diacylglycerol kinase family protein [Candidatus Limnocylindria bacterium]|nr:diacylglycerol kinase family protein [Candidatus Limnocylindria bacterium]
MTAATAILLNEGAGSARSERARRSVDLARVLLKADLHVTATRDPDALAAWMRSVVDGYRTIVVAGGDGSLGVAYNVLAGQDVTIGYIPAGFGNATAHLLRLPRDPGQLGEVLLRGAARPVDLVRVDGRLALFAGAGWDARVAARYAETGARRLVGWASAVARSLPDLVRRPVVRVTADDRVVHEGPMELAVVGTTPWFGRGLLVNPGATVDGSRLTLRVFTGPLPSFALETLRWVTRREPAAAGISARQVHLATLDGSALPVQADGDLLGERAEWSCEVAPAAVHLIGRW